MNNLKAFIYQGIYSPDVMSAAHGIAALKWFLYIPRFHLYFCNNSLTICNDDGFACWELGKNQKEIVLSKEALKKIKRLIKVDKEMKKLLTGVQSIIESSV